MARTGIQFSDVENAAIELQGAGKAPTVDGIRNILGTGSKSTISKYLRAWRAKQTEIEGTLPHELAALVTGLWQKLHNDADERIDAVKAEHQEQQEALNQRHAALQQDQIELKKQLHEHEEVILTERSIKEKLTKQLQEKQLKEMQLEEQTQSLIKQLNISQADNARLHQLTQSIQANLEHYQHETHQHQLKQSLQTEKQLGFYMQEITTLKQQLDAQCKQQKPLEQENEKLSTAKAQIENQNKDLQSQLKAVQQQLQDVKDNNNTLLERNNVAQDTLRSTQTHLHTLSKAQQQLETQAAILLEKNQQLQKELSHAQDKVETLWQEKLFLAQEKAQLQGFIKKMEQNA